MLLKQLSMGSGTSHFCSAGASSPFSSPTAAMLVCVGLPVDGARRAAGGVLIGTGGRAFAAAGRGSSLAPSVPLFYWAPVWLSMRMPQPEITTTDGWPTPGGLGHRLDRQMGAYCCLLVSYRPLAGSYPKLGHLIQQTSRNERAGPRRFRTKQAERLQHKGRASHWALNGRKRSAFEIYATSQERPQAFQPPEPLLGPKQGPRHSKKRLRKLSAQGL